MFEFISSKEACEMIDLHFSFSATDAGLLTDFALRTLESKSCNENIYVPDIFINKFRFFNNNLITVYEVGNLSGVISPVENVFCFTLIKKNEELFGLNMGGGRFKLLFDGKPESMVTDMVWRVVHARN